LHRTFRPGSPGHLLYNLALGMGIIGGAPAWVPWVLLSSKRRRNFPERLGLRGMPPPAAPSAGPRIWVHAVSVGETAAAVPLLKQLRQSVPQAALLLSNVTITGRETAGKTLSGVTDGGFYFPFDIPALCLRVLDRVRPDVVVIVETEIWPNFLAACVKRDIPAVIVNGRISERSFRGYMRFRWFFAPVLRTFRAISAQTSEDADRFVALGAAAGNVVVGGNLKFDVSPPARADSPLTPLFAGEKEAGAVWVVAGSTHEGEEAAVLQAFAAARERNGSLKLLLAPRHPERFEAVDALARRLGVPLARRTALSEGARRLAEPGLLLDTVGELASAYAAGDLAFVGGSLVPKGGHNILEPAWYGVPTVVGPHMENFREIATAFLGAGALLQVAGEEGLAAEFLRLADDRGAFARTGSRARALIESCRGASERNAKVVLDVVGNRRRTE
jgi:3-deoxy-D-manno-octulosonic-acid transferase